jgi:hypothetical protein
VSVAAGVFAGVGMNEGCGESVCWSEPNALGVAAFAACEAPGLGDAPVEPAGLGVPAEAAAARSRTTTTAPIAIFLFRDSPLFLPGAKGCGADNGWAM